MIFRLAALISGLESMSGSWTHIHLTKPDGVGQDWIATWGSHSHQRDRRGLLWRSVVFFVGTIRNPGDFGYWYNFHRGRKEVLEALSLGQNASSWKMLPKVAWGHCQFSNHFNPDNLIAPWHSEHLGLSGSVRSAPLLMITLTLKSDTLHGTFADVFSYEEQLC